MRLPQNAMMRVSDLFTGALCSFGPEMMQSYWVVSCPFWPAEVPSDADQSNVVLLSFCS